MGKNFRKKKDYEISRTSLTFFWKLIFKEIFKEKNKPNKNKRNRNIADGNRWRDDNKANETEI